MFWPVVRWSALAALVTYTAIYSYWRRMPNYVHQRRVNEIQARPHCWDPGSPQAPDQAPACSEATCACARSQTSGWLAVAALLVTCQTRHVTVCTAGIGIAAAMCCHFLARLATVGALLARGILHSCRRAQRLQM